jgi:hypothetical protein
MIEQHQMFAEATDGVTSSDGAVAPKGQSSSRVEIHGTGCKSYPITASDDRTTSDGRRVSDVVTSSDGGRTADDVTASALFNN